MFNEKMIELGSSRSVIRELSAFGENLAKQIGKENVFDFTIGNPSVPTPKRVNDTIAELLKNPDTHGYTSAQGLEWVRKSIAEANRKQGLPISYDKIYMTCGASAALAIALKAAVTPQQNEVVILAPYFPEYAVFVQNSGGLSVVVPTNEDFQIDFEKLNKAFSPKTAAVIVNTPNNPSGIVYTKKTLKTLAEVLRDAENKFGTEIVLVSDEPYREIVFDGMRFESPVAYYENSALCYSYSKSFSLPGERIGFIAVSDKMKNGEAFYTAVLGAGRSLGYICAPSLFQQAVALCADEPTDISSYDENRKILVTELKKIGFRVVNPQGAFYLLMQAPNGDTEKFMDESKKLGILTVPTDSFGLRGFVRIATCVSKQMIERSLPQWKKLAISCGVEK